jgi:hypothetical protein
MNQVIERGIPMHDPRRGSSKYSFMYDMEIGDSVFFERIHLVKNGVKLYQTIVSAHKNVAPDRKFSIRKVDGGYRVWRTA